MLGNFVLIAVSVALVAKAKAPVAKKAGFVLGTVATLGLLFPGGTSQPTTTGVSRQHEPPAPTPQQAQTAPPPATEPSKPSTGYANRRALEYALEQTGVPRGEAGRSLERFEAAMRDPAKRRLVECLGVSVYDIPPAGHRPPTEDECRGLRRRFNIPD